MGAVLSGPGAGSAVGSEFEALRVEAAADAIKPAGAPAAPGAVAVPVETWEDWREAINMALAWTRAPYPELAAIYTPAAVEQLAQACFNVASKYGWTISKFWLRWKDEIVLLMVAGPLLRDTSAVIAAKRNAKPGAGSGARMVDVPAAPAGAKSASAEPSLKANE